MVKCVCEKACQARDNTGKIRTFRRGEVFSFKECPPNFSVKLKGKSKEDVVDSFLDAKFRYLEPHEAEGIL